MADNCYSTYHKLKHWQSTNRSAWTLRNILMSSEYFPIISHSSSLKDPTKPAHMQATDWWFYHLPTLPEHLAVEYLLQAWNQDALHYVHQTTKNLTLQLFQSQFGNFSQS